MFIVDNTGKTIVNSNCLRAIHLDDNLIKGCTDDLVAPIGEYKTPQEAAEMFVALCRAIEQGKHLFRMYKTGNEKAATDETAKRSKFTY